MDDVIVLEDTVTGELYQLIAERKTLKLAKVTGLSPQNVPIKDDTTGVRYMLIVENGNLMLKEDDS